MSLPIFNVNDCILVLTDNPTFDDPDSARLEGSSALANAMALARAAWELDVPVVRPAVSSAIGTFEADTLSLFERTETAGATTRFSDDAPGRKTVLDTSRGALIFAGRLSETLVSYSILSALADTYDVLIAVDACDGLAPAARTLAMRWMTAAGATITTSKDLLLRFEAERQWLRDANAVGTTPTGLRSASGSGFRIANAASPAR
jgi:hypothetical protein